MRGRPALVFELRGAEFERKMCAQCSTIGTDIGAVVTELAAPLSAVSALRRRNVFAVDILRNPSCYHPLDVTLLNTPSSPQPPARAYCAPTTIAPPESSK